MTDTAVAHLTEIIERWGDLQDALTAQQATGWPPVMGIAAITRTAEERDQAAAERANERSPDQLGTRPVPIALDVLDVMRTVEDELLAFTDVVASQIQRSPMAPAPRDAGWTAAEIARRDQLAAADADDRRRWAWPSTARTPTGNRRRPTGPRAIHQRTAPGAAAWLRDRLTAACGPFRPLTAPEAAHVSNVAHAAAQAIDRALGTARHTARLDRPCPHCRADRLELHGGDGQTPAVHCADCGWTKTAAAVA